MASTPNPVHPLWQALDAELGMLVRPLARQVATLIRRAASTDGTIPRWRLASLVQRISDLLAGLFGRSPADQFDAETGQPLTPAARLVAAGTRTAVQLAAAPVVTETTTLLADQPALLRVIITPPPASTPPRLLVDSTRSWVDPQGYRLSDRLWQAGEDVRARLDALLEYHINAGTPASIVADEAAQFLTVAGRGDVAGAGGSKGLYAARRLVQTETSRAYGSAVMELARSSPFVAAVGWRLGAHRGSDACDINASQDAYGLGPGNYPAEQAPRFPDHPNCRCSLIPIGQASEDGVRAKLQAWAGGTVAALPLDVATLTDAVTGIPAVGAA